MNRSTWRAVTLTALVLSLTGFGSRVSWTHVWMLVCRVPPIVAHALRDAAGRIADVDLSALPFPATTRLALSATDFWTVATFAAVGFLLAIATILAFTHRRRDPRRVAARLLRRGGECARAARRAGLARDAMRLVLRSGRA
jgi:hypothetical protein